MLVYWKTKGEMNATIIKRIAIFARGENSLILAKNFLSLCDFNRKIRDFCSVVRNNIKRRMKELITRWKESASPNSTIAF